MPSRALGLILLVAVAAGLGLLAAQAWWPRQAAPPALQQVRLFPQARALPPFSLRQAGDGRLDAASLRGRWTLVFLGFSACPDVCPTTLARLAQAQVRWAKLPLATRPRVLFVSVDPERDTPQRLLVYAHGFHPDTLAATGDEAALQAFARSVGFVFAKHPGPDYAHNPQDYSMDHSAQLAVLDPQARMAGIVSPDFDPAALARDLLALTEAGR
ncbi:MAG: SCO family protein [Pseudoxanthomonas sp.]